MGAPLARLLDWSVRRVGAPTVLLLALLWSALGCVALGLADVVRGLESTLLLPLVFFSVLLGWLLAKSPLPGWLGGLLASILGAEALLMHVGRLWSPLAAWLRSLPGLAWGVWRWPWQGRPDSTATQAALARLEADLDELLLHLRHGSPGGEPDSLVTTLAWGLVLWLVAAWAAWALRRRNWAWPGIAPAVMLLATSLSYARVDHYTLPLLLGLTLFLVAQTSYLARERRWDASQVSYYSGLHFDVTLMAGSVALTLMMLATMIPSLSVQPIVRSARRLVMSRLGGRERAAASLGIQPGSLPGTEEPRAAAGLPRSHLLGSGPELSQQVVMFVYPDGAWPQGAPGEPQRSYYWRGLTYDQYTGRGWRTSPTNAVQYEAGEMGLPSPASPSQPTLRQKVQAVENLGGRLYVTGELLTADHKYRVNWRSPTDAFGAEIQAAVYQADSCISLAAEEELRSAEGAYPDWVQEHYLGLPDEVPERVLALARSLTENEDTPYDQARAIERRLRTYPYDLDLPSPPPERDVADYFLFDLKRGYCDYYATAMVVLARAAGLPARLVIGYASGNYDAVNARYVVTEANAHSWVEVYFAGYGWIEFEPTASQARLERPAWVQAPAPREALQPAEQKRASRIPRVLLGALGLAATLALASLAWRAADAWRLRRLKPAAAVSTLYQRLYHHGRRLAVPTQAGSTAHEFEAALTQRVIRLTQDRRGAAPPASIAQNTRWLTDLYTRGLYSPHPPSAAERTQAIKAWRQLRGQLWLAWLWKKRRQSPERSGRGEARGERREARSGAR